MWFCKLYCSISRRVTGINNIQQSTLIGKKTFSTHCSISDDEVRCGSFCVHDVQTVASFFVVLLYLPLACSTLYLSTKEIMPWLILIVPYMLY